MKLVADENIDQQIVDQLRVDGHNVAYILELDPGINDSSVLLLSLSSEALLITADKDFGELVFRQGLAHRGVLLVRLAGCEPVEKASIISRILSQRGDSLANRFSVLTPTTLRIVRAR